MTNFKSLLFATTAAAMLAPGTALAQAAAATQATNDGEAGVAEIVVTAQKRAQKLNDVGISVTAASGDTLKTRGITDTSDLGKIVAGFRAAPSNNQTPVYTLRGVGLYDSALGSSPTVSVYLDEVPFAFPVMTKTASLDLERVEVLKGPQGTLFGQNSTGGAINYIAAKPTNDFAAGADLTYSRFGKFDATGFLSGPLTDTLKARLAVRAIEGGAYQYSLTRPNDRLGASRELQARLLLDFTPTDRLKISLNLTGSRDRSDTIGAQTVAVNPVVPALAAPAIPDLGVPALVDSPVAPRNPRAADWTPGFSDRARDSYYQAALRAEYRLTDQVTFLSITNFAHQHVDKMLDQDSAAAYEIQIRPFGQIDAFNQEFRLTGNMDGLNWIVGASYDHDKIEDSFDYFLPFNSTNQPLPTLPRFEHVVAAANQKVDTYAAFANAEYKISQNLSIHGGIRYTNDKREGDQCSYDNTANQFLTAQFNGLEALFRPTDPVFIPARGCIQFLPDFTPTIQPFHVAVHEDNVSWRAGIDYKTDGGTLVYASASRGYKAGVISPSAAINTASNAPVKQERVDAYEIGLKAPLFNRRLQFNAAAFYYNYKDKQLRVRFFDPIFQLLEKLDNVPKSRVLGAEAEVTARPIAGLDLSASFTYLDTKVTGPYFTVNAQSNPPGASSGATADFEGSSLPYTPRYSAVADAQYQWPITDKLNMMVGGSMAYNSQTQTTFITPTLPAPDYLMPGYVTFDLRAGVSAQDGSWRVQLFGRNITNKFYVTNIADSGDVRYRYAGMPATYGITLTLRTR